MSTAPPANEENTESDFVLNKSEITSAYEKEYPVYEALREEVAYILRDRIALGDIKIHGIESRVKNLSSLIEKCGRKQTNSPFSDVFDIAAARVICLFRPDIEMIKRILHDNFEIISIDDKIDGKDSALTYLSVHFICKMKSGFTGPRYENIRDRKFEIQLRTLCMHCWAAVSHYVDYKGEWDVPANLKMALSALSGLFYVADSEFEQFNAAMIASRKSAAEDSQIKIATQEINLDTVTALLRRIFPDRISSPSAIVSNLVYEIKAANYHSIDELEHDIINGQEHVVKFEQKRKKGVLFFTTVGATRHALVSVSPSFAEVREKEKEKMRHMARSASKPSGP